MDAEYGGGDDDDGGHGDDDDVGDDLMCNSTQMFLSAVPTHLLPRKCDIRAGLELFLIRRACSVLLFKRASFMLARSEL